MPFSEMLTEIFTIFDPQNLGIHGFYEVQKP